MTTKGKKPAAKPKKPVIKRLYKTPSGGVFEKPPHSGKAEMARRVLRAMELMVTVRSATAAARIMAEEFGVSVRQAHHYVRHAFESWQSEQKASPEELMVRALADREYLINAAVTQGRLQTALNAMDSRDGLNGLKVERHSIVGHVGLADLLGKAKGDGFVDSGKGKE